MSHTVRWSPRVEIVTERWSNADGWSMDLPVGWELDDRRRTDDGSSAYGWVPPSAVGRLSFFGTVIPKTEMASEHEFAMEIAQSFARMLGLPLGAGSVLQLQSGHRAVELRGKSSGRHTTAVVHAFGTRMAVLVAWHTADPHDPDSPLGIAAARSVRLSRTENAPRATGLDG